MSHTKGPWKVKNWKYASPGRESVPTITNGQDAIAEVFPLWCPDDRGDERAANARLIAAAPELLEALTNIYGELCEMVGFGGVSTESMQDAESAIAKAEGR